MRRQCSLHYLFQLYFIQPYIVGQSYVELEKLMGNFVSQVIKQLL